jgi:hypothetical protein
MAISGVGTSLKLTIATVVTEVAVFLDSISPKVSPDKLDGTVFQPGVANPKKDMIAGFSTEVWSLKGKWSAAAHTAFRAINGVMAVPYTYGPDGTTAGKTKISGLCNMSGYSGPDSSVAGITTFTIDMDVTTSVDGVYP